MVRGGVERSETEGMNFSFSTEKSGEDKMDNLKRITEEEFQKRNDGICFAKGFHAIISCRYIQTWEQLAEALGNAFQFPMRNEGMDGTWDWLTDLSWLGDREEINLYFDREKELLKSDSALKEKVFDFFERLVLFWREDVKEAFIAGAAGKPKQFNVYLVN